MYMYITKYKLETKNAKLGLLTSLWIIKVTAVTIMSGFCFSGTTESPMENLTGRFRQTFEEEEDPGDVHGRGGHAPVQVREANRVPVAARVVPR